MTEAEKIALAMVNEVADQYGMMECTRIDRKAIPLEALCRAIEQHEAFKRELSEAIEADIKNYEGLAFPRISRFIIKPPVDPLVEALNEAVGRTCDYDSTDANDLRQALAARGWQIVEIGQ